MGNTTAFFANLGQGLVGGINLLHDVVMTAMRKVEVVQTIAKNLAQLLRNN